MPSIHRSLLDLQTADTELEACRRRIRALQAELADESTLLQARARLERAQAALASAVASTRNGERTLETLNSTIAMLEKRLYDGSIHNAREATSVEEELRHRRADCSAAEDAVLDAMERTEQAQVELAAAQDHLATVEQARTQRVPVIKAEGREATARAQALKERRAALAAAAPPALLARYERLHETTKPAVVTIHGGCCGGCGVAVPSAMQQKVAADELVQCINCNRLLVSG